MPEIKTKLEELPEKLAEKLKKRENALADLVAKEVDKPIVGESYFKWSNTSKFKVTTYLLEFSNSPVKKEYYKTDIFYFVIKNAKFTIIANPLLFRYSLTGESVPDCKNLSTKINRNNIGNFLYDCIFWLINMRILFF